MDECISLCLSFFVLTVLGERQILHLLCAPPYVMLHSGIGQFQHRPQGMMLGTFVTDLPLGQRACRINKENANQRASTEISSGGPVND